MHSRGTELDREESSTDIEGPPEPKGTRERVEANEGRAESRRDTGHDEWQGPAGSTRLRAAPLASPPTFSGPRTRLRLRPGRQRRTRRGGCFLSGPAGERWTWPGSRGRESRGQRGAHLSTRAASAGACATEELCVRLVGVLTQVRTIPPRARSHGHRSTRNHRKAKSRFVTGARLPALSRRRACAVASVQGNPAAERYLRSTGPDPRPRP